MAEKKLNTVIIDDDANSRKLLQILLKKFPQINVVGEAADIPKALEVIKRTNPDSIFLDICLDDTSGFELMKKIKTNPKIVFVSAYDNYALQAFDVDALDYLQKPIAADRLAKTIDKLLNSFKASNGIGITGNGSGLNATGKDSNINHEEDIEDYPDDTSDADDKDEEYEISDEDISIRKNGQNQGKVLEYDDRLFVTFDGVSKFIKVNSIVCITAEKDYSYIYTFSGKKHLVLKSMVEWEERLTPKFFVRIHRSTIVNLEFVERVEKWFNSSYHVYLQHHTEPFKMSRRYAAKLKEKFK